MTNDKPAATGRGDLTRAMLSILLIVILIGASFWVLRPFLLPAVWAAMIVVATWPLMLKVQAKVRRRTFAVSVMTGAMLLVFVVPLLLAIQAFVGNMDAITGWLKGLPTAKIPPAPEWVAGVPLVGKKVAERWTEVAAAGTSELLTRLQPFLEDAAKWLAGAAGSAGALALEFFLTVAIAAIMYAQGEAARDGLIRFGRRLAGERGERLIILAGQAVRAVALGVVVTALVQTVLVGIGLAVTGVPFAGVLTAVVLLLCIAQIGPLVVLVPAVVWLYWSGDTLWGTVLLVWSIAIGPLDNILRPILIRKGADLPMLLIFAGVIGGLVAFGIVGLFVGPVVLAVGYTLLSEWVSEHDRG
ncbi:MAG TPA: AI-2E family transporter YdiK [Casimicrobiaceae bacterium]|nr:AI-2E family transporter YdiK [Casimicrobiaceae bacterium]